MEVHFFFYPWSIFDTKFQKTKFFLFLIFLLSDRLWTRVCLKRLPFCVNDYPQFANIHLKGRSPVWDRKWSKKLCHFLKIISHDFTSHFMIRFHLFVRGFWNLKILKLRVSGISSYSMLTLLKFIELPCSIWILISLDE